MRTRFSSCEAVDRARPRRRRRRSRTGPIARRAAGDDDRRAGAVAEEAGGAAVVEVERSGSSARRRSRAATPARPDSICRGGERERREEAGAGGADVDRARRRAAPSRSATSGAAFGISSSWVEVATRTRSTSAGSTPARSSAAPPASAASSASGLARGARARRSWTPVRLSDPVAVDAEPRGDRRRCRRPGRGRAVATRRSRPPGARRAARGSRCPGSSTTLGTGGLRVRAAFDLDLVEGPADQLASTRPGPTSQKRRGAELAQARACVSRQRTGLVSAAASWARGSASNGRRGRRRRSPAPTAGSNSTSARSSANGSTAGSIVGRVEGAGDRETLDPQAAAARLRARQLERRRPGR